MNRIHGIPNIALQLLLFLGAAAPLHAQTITGKIYGGGEIATVNGDTNVLIISGNVSDNVYGGGYGETAVVEGNTIVNLNGGTVGQDIFAGGDAAPVTGSTSVSVCSGSVRDIFGGGRGSTAVVNGNTLVHVDKPYDHDLTLRDVYGGGDAASVDGTAGVQLDRGTARNVYGGGNAADVINTDVVVNGGEATMAFAGGHGDKTADPPVEADVSGDAHLTIHGGTVAKAFAGTNSKGVIAGQQLVTIVKTTDALAPLHVSEVYGGGNQADGKAGTFDIGCTGDATEGIGDLFGGAREAEITGNVAFTISGGKIGRIFGGNNVSGNVNGSIQVNIAENIEKCDCGLTVGYVYGGGHDAAYAPTAPDARLEVNIQGGSVEHDVFGGGLGATAAVTAAPVVNISGGNVDGSVFGGGSLAPTDGHPTVNVTGGSVTHDVYGGGALANVTGSTNLNLAGGAVGGAYGGALGARKGVNGATEDVAAYVEGGTTVTLHGTQITQTGVFGCNNLNGTPRGHAFVHVLSTTPRPGYDYDVPAVYGGGNLSAYEPDAPDGYTEVLVENCSNSIEYVYGGGNAAPVPATKVTIYGADAICHAFAGGNGAGQSTDPAAPDYNLGADVGYLGYYSQGSATPYGTGRAVISVFGGTILEVFGGSNTLGYIRGGTEVTVREADDDYSGTRCPLSVGNVFGGGNEADIDCAVTMNLDCSEGSATLFAGANNANVNGDVTINISSGTFGRVFCGNNTGGNIYGQLTLNVDETGCWPVMIGELYACGNEAPYSVYGYDDEGQCITSRDAMTMPKPYGSPCVNLISFTRIGKVFGGGYGHTAVLYGDSHVSVEPIPGKWAGRTVAPAFVLDADDRRVALSEAVSLPHGVTAGDDGTITIAPDAASIGSIYGGGNAGAVYGDTYVDIGLKTSNRHILGDDTDTEEEVAVTITGNVFGGGNEAIVSGNTNVKIGEK